MFDPSVGDLGAVGHLHKGPAEDRNGLCGSRILDGLVSVEDAVLQHPPALVPPAL